MTSLASAIRSNLDDGTISSSELKTLLDTAQFSRSEGVDTEEIREILGALQQADHGLTPALRAQLAIRLGDMGAPSRAALDYLNAQPRPPQTERERLEELRYEVEFAVASASQAANRLIALEHRLDSLADLDALAAGRLRPVTGPDSDWQDLVADLNDRQSETAAALDLFRARISNIPVADRQNAFASIATYRRRAFQDLRSGIPERFMVGASPAERESLRADIPASGLGASQSPSTSVAGLQFSAPTLWAFGRGTLTVDDGTELVAVPHGGSFAIEGQNLRLPGQTLLESGGFRVESGAIEFERGARMRVGGVPLEARESGAQVRGSNSMLVAGPGVEVQLLEIPAENASHLEHRQIRYTGNELTFQDLELRRGTGRFTALFDGGAAVGILQGSNQVDPGALVYARARGGGMDPTPIVTRAGSRGEVRAGAVVMRDGAIAGVVSPSTVALDGLEFSVLLEEDGTMSAYRYESPGRHVFGAGVTVEALPPGKREVVGDDVIVRLTTGQITVRAGGVEVVDGELTAILPGSVIETRYGVIESGDGRIALAPDSTLGVDSPNALYLSGDQLAARGAGFRVLGESLTGLLSGGPDPIYQNRLHRGIVELDGGTVRLERSIGDPVRRDGVRAFDITGAVSLRTGSLEWSSNEPARIHIGAPGYGGTIVRVEYDGATYEIDPRPMGSTFDPATDPGRFRRVDGLRSQRFSELAGTSTSPVLAGASIGPESDERAVIHAAQDTLSAYLGRTLARSGEFDAATLDAVSDFQRFTGLEATGRIDRDTLLMLDEVATTSGERTVLRITTGPLSGAGSAQAESILAGFGSPIRYVEGGDFPRSDLVVAVQALIGTTPDGIFGPNTRRRVQAWQQANGIEVTGAIDAATLHRMLSATGSDTQQVPEPRPRVMVMIAMNDEVPDELRRFRQLADRQGATPVIIGPPNEEFQSGRELVRYLAMVEAGTIDLDWLVISGHSTGTSTWGNLGTFKYSWLEAWQDQFPAAFAQIEKLTLLNCYNVTPERARNYWPSLFPNLQAAAGFMYSAPGLLSQTSDEFLINSGAMMARLGRGDQATTADGEAIARGFESDHFIRVQNAAVFVRTDGDGVFGMTATARREMSQHGAAEELRAIPPRYLAAFTQYFLATSPEYADPPSGHNSVLRQYLGAVQHVVDRWEGRMQGFRRFNSDEARFLASHRSQYIAAHGSADGYEEPYLEDYPAALRARAEHYLTAWNWEDDYQEVQRKRAQILNLIKARTIQNQFAQFNAPAIDAFNSWLADEYAQLNAAREESGEEPLRAVLLPDPSEWANFSRMEMLERLRSVEASLSALSWDARYTVDERPAWAIMSGRDPSQLEIVAPGDFFARARIFVHDLDPTVIEPEWLDNTLFGDALQRHEQSRDALAAN